MAKVTKTRRPAPISLSAVTHDWNRRDAQHILGWRYYPKVVFQEGEGVVIRDVEGNEYLDFMSGMATLPLGYNHPELKKVLFEQGQKLWHYNKYFVARPLIELTERLVGALPEGFSAVNYTVTGSEANEVAMRMARVATGRYDFVSVLRGLHGGSLAVEALTSVGVGRKGRLGPLLMPAALNAIVPPYCYRCWLNLSYPACNLQCLDLSNEIIERAGTGEVAAIFAETIIGAGGLIVPPEGWLKGLKALAEKWGALLVLDEIQVAPARTGRMWCFEHYGVVPDIITLGKSLGGGLPLAAAVTTQEVASATAGQGCGIPWAGTFSGDALAAAVADRQLQILIESDYPARAAALGERLLAGLRSLQERYEAIGDVRGKGLYVGVEIVQNRHTKGQDSDMASRIRWNALFEGLLIYARGHILNIFPPLIVTPEQIDEGLDILETAVRRALDGHPKGVKVFAEGFVPR